MNRKSKFLLTVLIFGIALSATAQSPAPNAVRAAALAKFEKTIERGDFAAVERELLDYAIANPLDARAFELLGRMRHAQKRLAEAKSLYRKALALDPASVAAKINLAVIELETGGAAQAVAALDEIAAAPLPDDRLRLKLAEAYALAGDCRRALAQTERLAPALRNADALPLRADCLLAAGEREKAVALAAAAKLLARKNPAAARAFAESLSSAGLHREAAGVLLAAVAAAPSDHLALVRLAEAQILSGDLRGARINLDRAARLKNDAPELFAAEGLFESESGRAAQAVERLEKALALDPAATVALGRYVVAAMRANQPGKAFRAAERLLELKPGAPESVYLHGAAALQNNQLAAAENSLRRFLALRPADSRGCLALGLTLAAQPDKIEAARRQLIGCVESDPRNFEALYQLGLSYKAQGENARAIEYFERTVKIAPAYAAALRELGAVYLQTGGEAKARAALEKAVALAPEDADAHFQLARLYNLTGEAERARRHLEIFQKLRNPVKNGM